MANGLAATVVVHIPADTRYDAAMKARMESVHARDLVLSVERYALNSGRIAYEFSGYRGNIGTVLSEVVGLLANLITCYDGRTLNVECTGKLVTKVSVM